METYKEYKESMRKCGLTPESWWEWTKFKWFGDGKILIWMMYAPMVIGVIFWSVVIFVLSHFIIKYW